MQHSSGSLDQVDGEPRTKTAHQRSLMSGRMIQPWCLCHVVIGGNSLGNSVASVGMLQWILKEWQLWDFSELCSPKQGLLKGTLNGIPLWPLQKVELSSVTSQNYLFILVSFWSG